MATKPAILITVDEYLTRREEHTGWCPDCGRWQYGIDLYAQTADCVSCGGQAVRGVDRLLKEGLAEVVVLSLPRCD